MSKVVTKLLDATMSCEAKRGRGGGSTTECQPIDLKIKKYRARHDIGKVSSRKCIYFCIHQVNLVFDGTKLDENLRRVSMPSRSTAVPTDTGTFQKET